MKKVTDKAESRGRSSYDWLDSSLIPSREPQSACLSEDRLK